MEIFRFSHHYIVEENNKKNEISINRGEFALECTQCNSFNCRHIKIIWNDELERNYLEKLRFPNPLKWLSE